MSGAAEEAYGVAYTPRFVSPFTDASRALSGKSLDNTSFLDTHGIKYIRVQWLDLINTVRCRIVPRAHMVKILQTPRPGITTNYAILGIVGVTIAPGWSDVGEHLYLIDPLTFRICTYAPGHASVMGVFQEKTTRPQYGLDVPTCPRTQLKRIEHSAKMDAGITFLVGFEIEFILLKEFDSETGKFVAANDAEYTTSAKLPTGGTETIIMEAIVDALIAADVEVLMMHPEAAPGQYEVITGPLPPVEAADALVFTTETIRNVAAKHGYRATFAPRLYADQLGSGLHAHISVHETSSNASGQSMRGDETLAPNLTAIERSFLQGMLSHLPALCALTLPTAASYSRVDDGIVSGGSYVVWGSDNRETPIRLCGMPRSQSAGGHHFEVKCLDSTACSYIALAGLLGMGADAIKRGAPLTHRDCNTKGVYEMSAEEKAEFGVRDGEVRRLPRSIEEARSALEADREVVALTGERFVRDYLSVNKLLQEALAGVDDRDTTIKLIKKY